MFFRVALRLSLVSVCLRLYGFSRTQSWLTRRAPGALAVDSVDGAWTSELSRVVDRVAHILPWRPACLTRSLALWSLLREQGVVGRFCVGARLGPDGVLAHAWVELNGQVLNDAPDVACRFPPLGPAMSMRRDSDSNRL